jgi:probable addiction module antidote protein
MQRGDVLIVLLCGGTKGSQSKDIARAQVIAAELEKKAAMTLKTEPYDPALYLDSPAAIAAYLDEAFEIGDPAFIADALGVVARAHGMAQVAKESGLGRESPYKALSPDGHPELATVVKVMRTMGQRLSTVVLPIEKSAPRK